MPRPRGSHRFAACSSGSMPVVSETLELVAGLVDDAERRIAGAGQCGSRFGQLLQQGIEGLLRAERDAGVDEAAEALTFGRLGHSGIIGLRSRVRCLVPAPAGPLGGSRASRSGGSPSTTGSCWTPCSVIKLTATSTLVEAGTTTSSAVILSRTRPAARLDACGERA